MLWPAAILADQWEEVEAPAARASCTVVRALCTGAMALCTVVQASCTVVEAWAWASPAVVVVVAALA